MMTHNLLPFDLSGRSVTVLASGPQVSNCTHLSDFTVCETGAAAIA